MKLSEKEIRIRKSRLRPIDTQTRYDIAGNMKRLARDIERGEEGEVRDVVVAWRELKNGGGTQIHVAHYGTGTFSDCLYVWESAKAKMT